MVSFTPLFNNPLCRSLPIAAAGGSYVAFCGSDNQLELKLVEYWSRLFAGDACYILQGQGRGCSTVAPTLAGADCLFDDGGPSSTGCPNLTFLGGDAIFHILSDSLWIVRTKLSLHFCSIYME
ncbi:unnamed protein product [Calypogeia fissa]